MHIRVQADRYAIDSQRPDWLVQLDLALFDLESLRVELVRDVRRRDRAEQLALISDTG
jgi:hypothetical protein